MLTFGPDSFTVHRATLAPLFLRHWGETGLDHSEVPFDVDWDRLASLETLGVYRAVFARDETGTIQGYNLFMVCAGLHHRSTTQAYNDSFYLTPEVRTPWAYLRLFHSSLEYLRALKVQKVYVATRTRHDFSPLMRRLGFDHIEQNWAKLL